jgi:uncharacterized repeat protein (TIGR01451 family)
MITAVSSPERTTGNNIATISTTVSTLREADLVITKTYIGEDPIFSGDAMVYQVTLTNNGNTTASGITITETYPSEFRFLTASLAPTTPNNQRSNLTLLPGSGLTFTITGQLGVNANPGSGLVNRIQVTTTSEENTTGNNLFTLTGTVGQPDGADIVVNKIFSGSLPSVSGDAVQYIITVTNTGNVIASGVVLQDILPSQVRFVSASLMPNTTSGNTLTWNLNTLATGASTQIILNTVLNSNYPVGTTLTNTASGSTPNELSNLRYNNVSSVQTNVIANIVDLAISKTVLTNPPTLV